MAMSFTTFWSEPLVLPRFDDLAYCPEFLPDRTFRPSRSGDTGMVVSANSVGRSVSGQASGTRFRHGPWMS